MYESALRAKSKMFYQQDFNYSAHINKKSLIPTCVYYFWQCAGIPISNTQNILFSTRRDNFSRNFIYNIYVEHYEQFEYFEYYA